MVNFNHSSAIKFAYVANPAVNKWNIDHTAGAINSPIKDALKAIRNDTVTLNIMKNNGFIVQKGGIYSGKETHYAIGSNGKAKIIPQTLKSKITSIFLGVRGQEKQDLREINRALKSSTSSSKFYLNENHSSITKKTSTEIKNVNDSPKVAKSIPQKYKEKEVNDWLFNGKKHAEFPTSKLDRREQEKYAPKLSFGDVKMLSTGKYTSRIGIYQGGITDLKTRQGETAAVGDSNNGDLLTGCGYAVAKAVVNATGAGLQAELYNRFGVPGVMQQPQYGREHYGHTEGRGYAITCNSYDMVKTHGIQQIELLTVPMHSEDGLRNMYREALAHSKDRDYIALPMAGMSHPLLDPAQGGGGSKLSARIATEAVKEFIDANPESKLKVIFTIFNDQNSEKLYQEYAAKL